MFQPRGPYFRLSNNIAWKNDKENNNAFHSFGLRQSSNSFYSMLTYVLNRLFLSPLGGSYVILMPLSNNEWGNIGEGIEVNHNLKSLFNSFIDESYSKITSNWGINELATWQFYNRIHLPFNAPDLISLSAFSPYPYPSDNGTNLD